jgi:nicotinamide phosphoribosyltransferase
MCSNAAVDGNEITHVKRLLTEVYPNHSFSMVSDSYDYWRLVKEILPQCKEEILNHNGCISIRGDSGDPVEVVTETVFELWKIFGGTVNSKGYKVLDPHIKAIYGDSITPNRCQVIYEILKQAGFAINNVSLGVGSFSMMGIETVTEGKYFVKNGSYIISKDDVRSSYAPVTLRTYGAYTRDTFGIAVKATYAEDKDGNPIMIYKQPKECSWKKSQKGCCIVDLDGQNYIDGQTYFSSQASSNNLLDLVFVDGEMIKDWSLDEVRQNLEDSRK